MCSFRPGNLSSTPSVHFLCGDLGLTPEPHLDHAQYIKHSLTVLKSDKKAVFTAASKASEAPNWLMSLVFNHRDIEDAA